MSGSAHDRLAEHLSHETAFTPTDWRQFLALGEEAGLTLTGTLSVVERAQAERRRPADAFRELPVGQSSLTGKQVDTPTPTEYHPGS